ncbi:MAG: hypothetical protein J6J74_08565 [Elusimicrobiaceae bacterium]|nr:hypothetical protein [Elusimicrobiaceae bacterium]
MDDFEKMMEAEGVKPAKDDFKELIDFIMVNAKDKYAIEDVIAAYSDKLADEYYQRGYQDGKKEAKQVMQKKIEEAANEIESLASIPF